jgi:hypothetical protein
MLSVMHFQVNSTHYSKPPHSSLSAQFILNIYQKCRKQACTTTTERCSILQRKVVQRPTNYDLSAVHSTSSATILIFLVHNRSHGTYVGLLVVTPNKNCAK